MSTAKTAYAFIICVLMGSRQSDTVYEYLFFSSTSKLNIIQNPIKLADALPIERIQSQLMFSFELYFGVELEFSFEIMDLFGYRNIKKLSPLSTIQNNER